MTSKESSVVFFNNISPDTTEVDLYPVFQEAGHVKSVRIKRDRETGASMGFGFCEYMDVPSAKAALSTVAGRPINGKAIKLDIADTTRSKKDVEAKDADPTRMHLPGGNTIQMALNNMHVAEVYEAVAQLRALARDEPETAKKVLTENPQLSLAVLYSLQHMGVIGDIPPEAYVAPEGLHPTSQSEGTGGGSGSSSRLPVRTGVTGGGMVQSSQQPPSMELLQMMANLSPDQLQKIKNLTATQIESLPANQRPFMKAAQRHLAEMDK